MNNLDKLDKKLVKISIYGWKNLFFQMLITTIVLFLSYRIGGINIAIVYIPCLIISRMHVEPPHANTRFKCFIMSIIVHYILIYSGTILVKYIRASWIIGILLVVIIMALEKIYILAK
ncbi:accessory gene regulator B family protein [Microaceticoccus formicicus]|uniref:accessory gene regulator B family protein n=1 Tax=Microaceticoccus formicicus TaxID=3118105 RepID=UPI003CD02F93